MPIDDARKWVQAITKTDDGLLAFLQRARGWIAENDRVYYPLQRRDLKNFLDYDEAVQRVQNISTDESVSSEDRQLANELLKAFRQDSEHNL